MSAARPTLSLSRKTPLKSKKSGSASSGKKKTPASSSSSCNGAAAAAPTKPWVDTVNDLNVYKPSKEELEGKKAQRKSQNKVLAKVGTCTLYSCRVTLRGAGVSERQAVAAPGPREAAADTAAGHAGLQAAA